MNILKTSKGFTILEIMIAMAAFSSMVFIASLTIVQIGKMYYKGVNASKTQETVRSVMFQISTELQYDKKPPTSGSAGFDTDSNGTLDLTVNSYCVGSSMYSYVINRRVTSTTHALWKSISSDPDVCSPINLSSPPAGGYELLGDGMRLRSFSVTPIASSGNKLVNINLGILYGDDDLVTFGDNPNTPAVETDWAYCRVGVVGSEWCTAADLTTQLYRRLDEEG